MSYAPIAIKERAVYLYLFEGYTYWRLEEIFGYSDDAIKKWVASYKRGELWIVKKRGCPKAVFDDDDLEIIRAQLEKESHTSVRAMTEILGGKCGKSSVHKAYKKLGLTFKKNARADERDREDVIRQRTEWLEWRKNCDTELLVFIDESAAKTRVCRH